MKELDFNIKTDEHGNATDVKELAILVHGYLETLKEALEGPSVIGEIPLFMLLRSDVAASLKANTEQLHRLVCTGGMAALNGGMAELIAALMGMTEDEMNAAIDTPEGTQEQDKVQQLLGQVFPPTTDPNLQ